MIETIVYALSFVIVLVAFCLIRKNFQDLKKHDEGTEEMQD